MFFTKHLAQSVHLLGKLFFAERVCVACHAPFIPASLQDGKDVGGRYLCSLCLNQMPKVGPVCTLCGHTLPYTIGAHVCLSCLHKPPPWDSLHFYAPYTHLCKKLILQYKYHKDFALIPLLAAYLHTVSMTLPAYDLILPMPRHFKRLRSQGYNHMGELCHTLAKITGKPYALQCLQRTRYTPPQAGLQLQQRKANPVKSFAATQVQDKHILLVDDVMTTGATLHHACVALRKAGAARIYIALLARAEK